MEEQKEKPVGLVYIGIRVKDEVKIFRRELKGDRNKIRQRAMMHALYNLLKILKIKRYGKKEMTIGEKLKKK